MQNFSEDALRIWRETTEGQQSLNFMACKIKFRQSKPYEIGEFTCATCQLVATCDNAFGLFNTDGDCSKRS